MLITLNMTQSKWFYIDNLYVDFNLDFIFLQNFQILLKHAIIADRVDYVTVLLQEENVQFDKEDFPKIYQVRKLQTLPTYTCAHTHGCKQVRTHLSNYKTPYDETPNIYFHCNIFLLIIHKAWNTKYVRTLGTREQCGLPT